MFVFVITIKQGKLILDNYHLEYLKKKKSKQLLVHLIQNN